ncbi:hypothetical protein EYF80_062696 [Liparis tanakae]|uniref:Uncharacterized protein n=1 Tax=Liparis tanakae TaxID=230148 RepID=A0A4Z2EFR3_9TELE|nr:hypothetical protein EYF80_062696 [Liparis tanakae]
MRIRAASYVLDHLKRIQGVIAGDRRAAEGLKRLNPETTEARSHRGLRVLLRPEEAGGGRRRALDREQAGTGNATRKRREQNLLQNNPIE